MPTLAATLPVLNACLNGTSAVCLLLGYLAIRRGDRVMHSRLMRGAFLASSVFLASYLTRMALFGSKHFVGTGAAKAFYLTVLFSHMFLAMGVLPLVLRVLYLALKERFAEHRRLARVTYPAWLYVSVTGVVVYFMLYHWPVPPVIAR
jgi:putative membrane protein